MCYDVVDKAVLAAAAYGRLQREGPEAVRDLVTVDDASLAICESVRRDSGNGIFVVPHCAGSVLATVEFARRFPTMVLVRESKSEHRGRIFREYFERLGAEILYVRRAEPASIARAILRALNAGKFIIGTTDLLRRTDDTVEVVVFGRKAHLPAWPARFSARRNVPILPGYIRMEEGRIILTAGEPYIEPDLTAATQRWASFFEQNFRRHPSDWVFMYEKRWSKLIGEAARERR